MAKAVCLEWAPGVYQIRDKPHEWRIKLLEMAEYGASLAGVGLDNREIEHFTDDELANLAIHVAQQFYIHSLFLARGNGSVTLDTTAVRDANDRSYWRVTFKEVGRG